MKIRNGFVSNSSSSSFVALAVPININDITSEMIKKCEVITFGAEISEGIDMIEINSEDMIKFFKLFPRYDNDWSDGKFCFWKVIKSGDGGFTFNKSELPDEHYEIVSETIDQHSSTDLNTLIERYTNKEKDAKILTKLYREKKLNRINNED
jgi:hypothetical protein